MAVQMDHVEEHMQWRVVRDFICRAPKEGCIDYSDRPPTAGFVHRTIFPWSYISFHSGDSVTSSILEDPAALHNELKLA